jgi:hypothetical protein
MLPLKFITPAAAAAAVANSTALRHFWLKIPHKLAAWEKVDRTPCHPYVYGYIQKQTRAVVEIRGNFLNTINMCLFGSAKRKPRPPAILIYATVQVFGVKHTI